MGNIIDEKNPSKTDGRIKVKQKKKTEGAGATVGPDRAEQARKGTVSPKEEQTEA